MKLDRLWRAAGRTLRSRLLLPWAVLLLLAACTQADNPQAPTPEEPPPSAPSGLEAAAQAGQVVLRWQGQEDGVVGYHVYRSVGEVVPLAEALRLTAEAYQDSSYTDDQLEEAGVYYYRVTAVNAAGQESAASEAVRVLLEPEESGEDPGDEPFTAIAWSPAGKAPLALTEAQGTVLGGELYIFGGYTSFVPDFHTTTAAYAYDPVDGQWRQLADMPVPWTHAGAVVDGQDIYLAGGYENPNDNRPREEISDGERTVYRYNVDEDRWYSDLPELPEPRGSGGFVRLDRNLHFFGGHTPEREDRQEHWVLSLDLPEAGWQPLEPLPNPRNHLGVVALEGM
ncbi:MAG: hypothetical protein M3498_14550, partial [Deinococcota bacterium]|nr:hypothetical protein [Deinococcota bacterium]